jgi:glutamate synthase domain-containing protein 2
MELRQRFDYMVSAKRLHNFFEAWTDQMVDFARMCGRRSLHDLSYDDLATTHHDIARYTPIQHV